MANNHKPMTTARVYEVLHMNWHLFNATLRTVNEAQAAQLLTGERQGRRRHIYLMRLYGKWSTMRERRERRELLQSVLERQAAYVGRATPARGEPRIG